MPSANQSYDQTALIAALLQPKRYPHPVKTVEHLQTHISHVLLAGDYAYKIKKSVDLGFLDFSTLENSPITCRGSRLCSSATMHKTQSTDESPKGRFSMLPRISSRE